MATLFLSIPIYRNIHFIISSLLNKKEIKLTNHPTKSQRNLLQIYFKHLILSQIYKHKKRRKLESQKN
jgi:hypothetical protein